MGDSFWEFLPPPVDWYEQIYMKRCIPPDISDCKRFESWSVADEEEIYLRKWNLRRDYNLFAALANVRSGRERPSRDPRGVPHDSCCEIKTESEEVDWHSHSHWMLEAMRAITAECGSNDLKRMLRAVHSIDPSSYVRFVFWFDN